jgi:putative ATPase
MKDKNTFQKSRPLADLMRPEDLQDVIGQDHLFGENGALSTIIKTKNVPSMILWGPPGVGKTTIAKALTKVADAEFVTMSAINSGAAEIRKVIEAAKSEASFAKGGGMRSVTEDFFSKNSNSNSSQENHPSSPTYFYGAATPPSFAKRAKTILMIDEIHHFNKTQQDLFLPFIEDGTIILIGTTTENPSFQLNSALLSRCKVLTLKSLDEAALEKILQSVEKSVEKKLPLDEEAREILVNLSCGDARYLLNACEELFAISGDNLLNKEELQKIISKRSAHFDKKGDFHYGLISAFHKSLRGSDVDAALYYLARMLEAKENPYYILRRLARFATEDIGLADPNALLQVMAAKENYDFLGSPEGDYAISHAIIYCATAPKSNASYLAHKAAIDAASRTTNLMPPKNILNAPTKMMKNEGFGEGYIYDHDTPNCFSGQEFFPDELLKKQRPKFFEPNERGFERDLKKRLSYWEELRNKIRLKN